MSIVSSTIIREDSQGNGTTWTVERHTDSQGIHMEISYLRSNADDKNILLAQHAQTMADALTTQEIQEVLSGT